MTRAEKVARARELRDGGARYQAIAEQLDVSTTTIYRWLNPERVAPYRNGRAIDPERTRELDRRYSATHRTECERCGGDRPRGSHAGPLCRTCISADADRVARQIEGWWTDGISSPEIQRRLGWTKGHLARQIHLLREKGYELPYRYRMAKPRFPDQVAA